MKSTALSVGHEMRKVHFRFSGGYEILYDSKKSSFETTNIARRNTEIHSGSISDMMHQGHPSTVFCKKSVRISKYRLKISTAPERLNISG